MNARVCSGGVLLVAALMAGCSRRENVGTIAGPGLYIDRGDGGASDAAADAGPEAAAAAETSTPPAMATFIDLSKDGAPIELRACENVVVAVAKGRAKAFNEDLDQGDVIIVRGRGRFDLRGEGMALVASVQPRTCDAPTKPPALDHRRVRASAAKELSWAGGTMFAHLDADETVSPLAYVGRLRGTAPVAEHSHAGTWELLAAIEGAGTFTVGGVAKRLGPKTIVLVPPDTPHRWEPDSKVELSAIQMYVPPGPEQRFKKLAAEAAAPR
jgi:mannose-6-phosphate isomerase-like protein (cupin superfamily)